MSRFHPGWGRSSKSTEDVRVYVDPTSHVEEIEMTSINPETAPISISSSESSNDSSSSLVKPLDNLILGYSASQRKLAQNRWQFVRSKLPIIRAMSTLSLFEGVDPLIKNHLNDDIYNVSQAFRISLIVLLFIAAFSITGYQWSTCQLIIAMLYYIIIIIIIIIIILLLLLYIIKFSYFYSFHKWYL